MEVGGQEPSQEVGDTAPRSDQHRASVSSSEGGLGLPQELGAVTLLDPYPARRPCVAQAWLQLALSVSPSPLSSPLPELCPSDLPHPAGLQHGPSPGSVPSRALATVPGARGGLTQALRFRPLTSPEAAPSTRCQSWWVAPRADRRRVP